MLPLVYLILYAKWVDTDLRLLPHSAREPRGLEKRSHQAGIYDEMAEHHRPVRTATNLLSIRHPQRWMDSVSGYTIPSTTSSDM